MIKVLAETDEISVKLVNKNQGNDTPLPQLAKANEQPKVQIIRQQTLITSHHLFGVYQHFSNNKLKPSATCEIKKQEPLTGPLESTSKTENVRRPTEEVDSSRSEGSRHVIQAAGLSPLRKRQEKYMWLGGGEYLKSAVSLKFMGK